MVTQCDLACYDTGVCLACTWLVIFLSVKKENRRVMSYCVSLEGLDRSVLTQLTHMDAHVCAAGGKRVVALPVYVQSRCCWEAETELRAAAAVRYGDRT